MIGAITALIMLVTGWCLCDTRYRLRQMRETAQEEMPS